MAKFVLAYSGGGMGETEEDQAAVMEEWGLWFAGLGEAIVDMGAPFGTATTIAPDGETSDGGHSALTGYSIISAADLSEATDHAKGCPVLKSGGMVEVYEAMPIG